MNSSSRILISLGTVVLNAGLLAPASTQAQVSGNARDGESRAMVTIQELSEPDLKAFYVRCAHAAMQQALSGTEIALCSVGYELLLTRSFRGDFYAFLAWSRGHAEDVSEVASKSDKPIKRK
jgi:hypothetical protein